MQKAKKKLTIPKFRTWVGSCASSQRAAWVGMDFLIEGFLTSQGLLTSAASWNEHKHQQHWSNL